MPSEPSSFLASELASSALHEGGGGAVSNAADVGLVGHHVGGKEVPLTSLPMELNWWSTVASSADHVGGGGTKSLSEGLVNDAGNPMKLALKLGGALTP